MTRNGPTNRYHVTAKNRPRQSARLCVRASRPRFLSMTPACWANANHTMKMHPGTKNSSRPPSTTSPCKTVAHANGTMSVHASFGRRAEPGCLPAFASIVIRVTMIPTHIQSMTSTIWTASRSSCRAPSCWTKLVRTNAAAVNRSHAAYPTINGPFARYNLQEFRRMSRARTIVLAFERLVQHDVGDNDYGVKQGRDD